MELELNILKVFGLSAFSFFLAVALTPILTHFLYKHKMWRKKAKHKTTDGRETSVVRNLESQKGETNVPRMGGVLIWMTALIAIFFFWGVSRLFQGELTRKFDFLSRSQTWLPLFTLIAGAIVGLVDDLFTIYGRGKYVSGGLRLSERILIVLLIGAVGAWWFFTKLDSSFFIPFYGLVNLGILFAPVFMIVMLAIFSGGVIDGIDGLSGGIFAAIFSAYAGIAFFQNQFDLAAFSAVLAGSILAFLWFNIPPARFYMGETGILALTTALTVIAFLTNAVAVLPIIAFPLFLASGSSSVQLLSKKFRNGKKVFLAAPIHHHFEARGWPAHKVTMRFWIMSTVLAVIGMVIHLAGK